LQKTFEKLRNRITWQEGLLIAGIGAWLALNLWSLLRYPPPSCDEAYYTASAYHLLKTARFGLPFIADLAGAETSYVVYGRLFLLGQAVFLAFFRSPLFAARFFSFAGVIGLAVITYALANRLFDRRVALWSMLIIAVDWPVFMQGHSGRPDIWMTAAVMFDLLLVFWLAEKPSAGQAILAGFATALLQDIHLNGVHFIAAIGLIALIEIGLRQKRWGTVGMFALGGLLGAGYFLIVHLFPDPQLAITQYRSLTLGEDREFWQHSLGFHARNLGMFLWDNFVRGQSKLAIITAMFFCLGLIGAALRKDRRNALYLLIFFLVSLLSFSWMNVFKPSYYAVLWHPVLAILGTAGIFWLADDAGGIIKRLAEPVRRRLAPGLLSLLLAALSAGDVYLAVKFRAVDYAGMVGEMRGLIESGSRVMADELWWYGLYDQDMVASITLNMTQYTRHELPGDRDNLRADMDALHPDYVILDNALACQDVSEAAREYLGEYVEERCEAVGSVAGEWFETSTVYACSYD
jgi:4-amino-4-deoxy-L-arabinose transferase-like glycosyltransferase